MDTLFRKECTSKCNGLFTLRRGRITTLNVHYFLLPEHSVIHYPLHNAPPVFHLEPDILCHVVQLHEMVVYSRSFV